MRLIQTRVSLSLSLLLLGASAGVASQAVSGGSLRAEALSELTKGGKVTLVGFAWDGPARLFRDDFAVAALGATSAGDRSFSLAADGPADLCQSLGKLSAERTTLDAGRLSFQGPDGPLQALALTGITVTGVNCSAAPWTADLQAASIAPAEERTKDKAKKKAKQAKRKKAANAGKGAKPSKG